MSGRGRGRGKKTSKNDDNNDGGDDETTMNSESLARNSDEESGSKVLSPAKGGRARAKKPTATPAASANSKKQPKDAGVSKKRPLKRKQSDRLIRAALDGENIDQLKEMLKVFQNEDNEAQAKKEAKAKENKT